MRRVDLSLSGACETFSSRRENDAWNRAQIVEPARILPPRTSVWPAFGSQVFLASVCRGPRCSSHPCRGADSILEAVADRPRLHLSQDFPDPRAPVEVVDMSEKKALQIHSMELQRTRESLRCDDAWSRRRVLAVPCSLRRTSSIGGSGEAIPCR